MKQRLSIMAVAIGLVCAWATAAMAVEGRWFDTIDELEREEVRLDWEAGSVGADTTAIDELLEANLTDADTARRATEELRRDVLTQVARTDAARRQADRIEWAAGPRESRAMHRALDASLMPATDDWTRQVRLLAEVDDGVEYAGSLFAQRAALDVRRAHLVALGEKTSAERDWVIEQVSNGGVPEEIDEELERTANLLARQLDMLDRNPTTRDFHRRKGGLFPPVSAQPDHLFGPRDREGSPTTVRHTGVTYLIDAGTEVRSVGSGIVVHADRMPGYGKVVIVDHGGEYHSIYAHLDTIDVDAGGEITNRGVVGQSGESGSVEGPKLYFELRRGGVPVDPAEWFVSQ